MEPKTWWFGSMFLLFLLGEKFRFHPLVFGGAFLGVFPSFEVTSGSQHTLPKQIGYLKMEHI